MSCNIKRIKGCEIAGSTFNGRKLSLNRDFSNDTFKAKVKTFNQKPIAEIIGVKNATDVYFPFNGLENLSAGLYLIEYWGNFEDIGNELFCVEEFSVVAPSKAGEAQFCENSNIFNFEIKFEEISIPVTISKAINNFYLDFESLTDEQKAAMRRQLARQQGMMQTADEMIAALGYSRGRAEKIVAARREKEQLREQCRSALAFWYDRWKEPVKNAFGVFVADVETMKPQELRRLHEQIMLDNHRRRVAAVTK